MSETQETVTEEQRIFAEIEKSKQQTNLPQVDVIDAISHISLCVESHENIYLMGTQGIGKTGASKQAIFESGKYGFIVVNLSVYERPDLAGFPNHFNQNDAYIRFRKLVSMKPLMEGGQLPDFPYGFEFAEGDELFYEQKMFEAIKWMKLRSNKVKEYKIKGSKKHMEIVKKFLQEYGDYRPHSHAPYTVTNGEDLATVLFDDSEDLPKLTFCVEKCDPVPVVVILDEMDKAATDLNAPLLEFTQNHSINNERFPWIQCFIATGNMIHEGGNKPIPPLLGRFECYILNTSVEGVFAYSKDQSRFHPTVLSYIEHNPMCIMGLMDDMHYKGSNPRSLEKASTLISRYLPRAQKDKDFYRLFSQKIEGNLGSKVGRELCIYIEHYMEFMDFMDPVFKSIKNRRYWAVMDSVNDTIKKLSGTSLEMGKLMVVLMTMMAQYVVHVDRLSMKLSKYPQPRAKYAQDPVAIQELNEVCEEFVCLINGLGYFFQKAIGIQNTDTASGNPTNIISADLIVAVLHNNISSTDAVWAKYSAGKLYKDHVIAYVTDPVNANRPELQMSMYKELLAESPIPGYTKSHIGFALTNNPYWVSVLSYIQREKRTLQTETSKMWAETISASPNDSE